jgi:hypothetical protein
MYYTYMNYRYIMQYYVNYLDKPNLLWYNWAILFLGETNTQT